MKALQVLSGTVKVNNEGVVAQHATHAHAQLSS